LPLALTVAALSETLNYRAPFPIPLLGGINCTPYSVLAHQMAQGESTLYCACRYRYPVDQVDSVSSFHHEGFILLILLALVNQGICFLQIFHVIGDALSASHRTASQQWAFSSGAYTCGCTPYSVLVQKTRQCTVPPY
jgi:hypothetical protein